LIVDSDAMGEMNQQRVLLLWGEDWMMGADEGFRAELEKKAKRRRERRGFCVETYAADD
jgi:hypothetical protein